MIKVIAFDCFGTVFDMDQVNHEEIAAYVAHVRKNDFTPYEFSKSWHAIKAHADSAEGIRRLQAAGFHCVTLSNGSFELLQCISLRSSIAWDRIIDLAGYCVYKPHLHAYCTVEKETGFSPAQSLMVTANPTFGDLEGAAAISMHSRVIRQPGTPATILELAEELI